MWREEAAEAARRACRARGLSSDLRLLSSTTSTVYLSGNTVVKVTNTLTGGESGAAEIALASELRDREIETPAARWLVPHAEGRWRVTAFEAVRSDSGDPASGAVLAEFARKLAPLDVPTGRIDPIGRATRLFTFAGRAGIIAAPALDRITRIASRLRPEFDALSGDALLHGDLHPENVVTRSDGSPVLLDLGDAGYGPPEYEFSSLLLGPRLFGTDPREAGIFGASYGAPLTARGIEISLSVRVLLSASRYAAATGCGAPGFTRDEATKRIGRVIAGSGPEWSAPGTKISRPGPVLTASR